MNKVVLIGRLGADPELKTTQGGTSVAKFPLATSERYKDEEKTTWHRIVAWGKLAELADRYLTKGRQVAIEGRIVENKWETQEGQKRRDVEIHASSIEFLGDGNRQQGAGGSRGRDEITDDDVPF